MQSTCCFFHQKNSFTKMAFGQVLFFDNRIVQKSDRVILKSVLFDIFMLQSSLKSSLHFQLDTLMYFHLYCCSIIKVCEKEGKTWATGVGFIETQGTLIEPYIQNSGFTTPPNNLNNCATAKNCIPWPVLHIFLYPQTIFLNGCALEI